MAADCSKWSGRAAAMGSLGQFLERLPLDGDISPRKSAGEKPKGDGRIDGKFPTEMLGRTRSMRVL
jgi:hypothetical protein